MKARIVFAILLFAGSRVCMAGDQGFCELANRAANAGQLSAYTNQQLENGLCLATLEMMSAIAEDSDAKLDVCTRTAEHMMQEFVRRFPDRDPKSVTDKC